MSWPACGLSPGECRLQKHFAQQRGQARLPASLACVHKAKFKLRREPLTLHPHHAHGPALRALHGEDAKPRSGKVAKEG
jgi:hypothetical protein